MHSIDQPAPVAGIAAGALFGAIWGAVETGGRIALYRLWLGDGVLAVPPFGALDAIGAVVLSALEYAAVGAGLAVLGLLLATPLLAVLFPRRPTTWRRFVAPRLAVLGAAVFVNLFWWSRFASRGGVEFLRFAYSEPFHSPKRLALAAAFALLALLVAALLARALGRRRGLERTALWTFLVPILLAGGGFLLREYAIRSERPDRRDAGGRHNVVLVIVDTLRAQNMACYGYPRPTTPRLDAIAREGVLFERAVVQAPYTWTSFGSIFTGRYPRQHGLVKMDPSARFNPRRNVTLQNLLDRAGYRTGAFMTGMLSNASGLLDGFQTYLEAMVGRDPVDRASVWTYFRSELVLHALANKVRQAFDPTFVSSAAIDWIEANQDGRFLAVVHLYSTHTPYDPPPEYDVFSSGYHGPIDRFTTEMANLLERGQATLSEADHQRVIDLYDGGVLFADAMVGRIVDTLAELGILEQTVVVVTSDHGEELGEHGLWEHDWMYNTNQLVPLVLRLPDRQGAGTRVPVPVESVDILPTVLELIGLPPRPPTEVDGESLVPWIRGEFPKQDDLAFCENNFYVSVQNRDWKLVRNRFGDPEDPPRLYHLAADPGETRNVIDRNAEVARELSARLDAHEAAMPQIIPLAGAENEETERIMRELGYLHGDRPIEGKHERSREEPAGTKQGDG